MLIYFCFWSMLFALNLNWLCYAGILSIVVFLSPNGQRRYLVYTFIIALFLVNFQVNSTDFNTDIAIEGKGGYLYRILEDKADIYIDGKKYRIKSKDLKQCVDGQYVVLNEMAYIVQKTHNKNGFNLFQHYVRKGYKGYFKANLSFVQNMDKDIFYRRFCNEIRHKIIIFSNRLSPRSAVLMRALILGDLEDDTLLKNVKNLGLIHLFVISGFHFSAISVVLFFVLYAILKVPYRMSIIVVAGISLAYFGVIRSGYGSQRALVSVLAATLCFFTRNRLTLVSATLFYAALSLALDVSVIAELGFNLTCLSTLAVAVSSRLTATVGKFSKVLHTLVISLFVYSIIVCCLIYQSGEMSLSGILLMPIISPLVGGFIITSVIGLLLPSLGQLYIYQLLMQYLADSVYDWLDWSAVLGAFKMRFHPTLAVCFVILIVGILFCYMLRTRGWLFYRGLAIALSIAGVVLFSRVDWGLSIRSYALYDGESYLIRTPDIVMLYDVGNDPELVNLLKKEGVSKIDLIVISHAHIDHIGMLEEVCCAFKVGEVITQIDQNMVRSYGDTRLIIDRPPLCFKDNLNEISLVCQFEYKGFKMLLTGDLEDAGTKWLLSAIKGKFNVVKAPHHGSYNVHIPELLNLYQPDFVTISGGNGKRINKKPILKDLVRTKTPFCDTIIDGELHIYEDGDTYKIKTLGE